MDLKERIGQINQRMAQLEGELKNATTVEEIERASAESTKLIEERGRLTAQMQAEAVRIMQNPGGIEIKLDNGKSDENTNSISSMSKRSKINLIAGRLARKKGFNDVEKRALGTSLTTSATEYSEATEAADGVNNAGVFIPTHILFDLLKEDKKLSSITSNIAFTHIKGLTVYPYRKSRTKANVKEEGKKTDDGQMGWAELQLAKGKLQTIITVTDEVKNLTDFALGEYIINQLLQDLDEDWSSELIYGTGTSNRIKGITYGLTAKTYAVGKVLESIIASIKLCKSPYRKGAKLFVAQDVYDEIFFSQDANGNFKYPVFNNSTGISALGNIRVELDENLKDGEYLLGNINRYYKANMLSELTIENERHGREGITDHIANVFCAASPFDGAFIHGKKV